MRIISPLDRDPRTTWLGSNARAADFPPTWTLQDTLGGFVVRDANGQALAYFYGHSTGRRHRQGPPFDGGSACSRNCYLSP